MNKLIDMKKYDFIVIAVVIAVVGIMAFVLYGLNNESGKFVQVEIDGAVIDTVLISEDFEKEYTSADGGKNTLMIIDGKAKVTYADCPDGICFRHSAISRTGESIICLPHKLVVRVVDTAGEAEFDAVA